MLCLTMSAMVTAGKVLSYLVHSGLRCSRQHNRGFFKRQVTFNMSLKMSIHQAFCYYAAATAAKSLQSCPTLCESIDGGPPDSPVPGILQARTLEWVAISSSNA